jgi:hypothetical protein
MGSYAMANFRNTWKEVERVKEVKIHTERERERKRERER